MLLFCFSSTALHAHESTCSCLSSRDYDCFKNQQGDNLYINEEYLEIDGGKIFLDLGGSLVHLGAVYSDSQGLYLSISSESKQGWTCPVCGHRNPPTAFVCEKFSYHYDFD